MNGSDSNYNGHADSRMLQTPEQDRGLPEERDQQMPLFEDSNGVSIGLTQLSGNGSAGGPHNVNGVGGVPHKKTKFLKKLMNFYGDPKRRQQTCSKRSKTFTLCKEQGYNEIFVL